MDDKLDSSEMFCYVSGQIIENVNTVTEISDFEFDSKLPSSEAEISLSQPICNIISCSLSESLSSSKMEKLLDPIDSLPHQMKDALQDNGNLLKDKSIVEDLLQSETDTHRNNIINRQKKINCIMTEYIQEDGKCTNEAVKSRSQLNEDKLQKTCTWNEQKSISSFPYLTYNGTSKKSESCHIDTQMLKAAGSLLGLTNRVPKQVNFLSLDKENDSKIAAKKIETLPGPSVLQNIPTSVHNEQIYASYGPEIVFEKLGEIRTHLETKEVENDAEYAADLPLGRLLMAKLGSQKQRIKDLEEELTLNEASLTKATCELEVTQKRLLRREEQLREADAQIAQLQAEWQSIQFRLVSTVAAYRKDNESLRKEIEALKDGKAQFDQEVKSLRLESKELSDLKVEVESIKCQAVSSSQQCEEILRENRRLNEALEEKESRISHIDKELLPKVLEENNNLRQTAESLHTKLDTLAISRTALEDDLKQLKERHSVLLQKAVEEAELKDEAHRQKEVLTEELECLKKEGKCLQEELRQHYQCQLEAILLKKTKQLEAEFDSRLARARTEFEAEKTAIQHRTERALEDLRRRCDEEVSDQTARLRRMERENALLRSQRQAVAAAISAGETLAFNRTPAAPRLLPDEVKIPDGVPWHPGDLPQTHNPREKGALFPPPLIEELKPYEVKGPDTAPQRGPPIDPAPPPPGILRHHSNKGPISTMAPLLTSTSLSSMSVASSEEDHKQGTGFSRKKRMPATSCEREYRRAKGAVRRSNGRKVVTAAQMLSSCVSSSEFSKPSWDAAGLAQVDREMEELVREISSISSIGPPPGREVDEAPRHDTSVELDSARLALDKIDKVSCMLASAWQELKGPREAQQPPHIDHKF